MAPMACKNFSRRVIFLRLAYSISTNVICLLSLLKVYYKKVISFYPMLLKHILCHYGFNQRFLKSFALLIANVVALTRYNSCNQINIFEWVQVVILIREKASCLLYRTALTSYIAYTKSKSMQNQKT